MPVFLKTKRTDDIYRDEIHEGPDGRADIEFAGQKEGMHDVNIKPGAIFVYQENPNLPIRVIGVVYEVQEIPGHVRPRRYALRTWPLRLSVDPPPLMMANGVSVPIHMYRAMNELFHYVAEDLTGPGSGCRNSGIVYNSNPARAFPTLVDIPGVDTPAITEAMMQNPTGA